MYSTQDGKSWQNCDSYFAGMGNLTLIFGWEYFFLDLNHSWIVYKDSNLEPMFCFWHKFKYYNGKTICSDLNHQVPNHDSQPTHILVANLQIRASTILWFLRIIDFGRFNESKSDSKNRNSIQNYLKIVILTWFSIQWIVPALLPRKLKPSAFQNRFWLRIYLTLSLVAVVPRACGKGNLLAGLIPLALVVDVGCRSDAGVSGAAAGEARVGLSRHVVGAEVDAWTP